MKPFQIPTDNNFNIERYKIGSIREEVASGKKVFSILNGSVEVDLSDFVFGGSVYHEVDHESQPGVKVYNVTVLGELIYLTAFCGFIADQIETARKYNRYHAVDIMQQELNEANSKLEELENMSIFVAHMVIKGFFYNMEFNYCTTSCFPTLLKDTDTSFSSLSTPVYELTGSYSDYAGSLIESKLLNEISKYRPSITSGKLDLSGNITFPSNVIQYLCTNRQLITSISSSICNMFMSDSEYAPSDLIDRNATLYSILSGLSNSYPLVNSTLRKSTLYSSLNDLIYDMFSVRLDIHLDDITPVEILDRSQGMLFMTELTKVELILAGHKATNIIFGSDSIKLMFGKEYISINASYKDLLTNLSVLYPFCQSMIFLLSGNMKIHSITATNIMIDKTSLLRRIFGNLYVT